MYKDFTEVEQIHFEDDENTIYFGIRIDKKFQKIKLTMEAYRVYGFLCYCVMWDENKTGYEYACQASHKRIVEACMRQSYPESSLSHLKNKTIAGIKELVELCLIEKIDGQRNDDGGTSSNVYRLRPKSEWLIEPGSVENYKYNIRNRNKGGVDRVDPLVCPTNPPGLSHKPPSLNSQLEGGVYPTNPLVCDSNPGNTVTEYQTEGGLSHQPPRFVEQTPPSIPSTPPVCPTNPVDDDLFNYTQENPILDEWKRKNAEAEALRATNEPITLKEGECLVKDLATQEQYVLQLKNTRKLAVPEKNEITVKVIDCHDTELIGKILLGFKKGCEPVELNTSEKLGELLQIFTNRVKIPEIDCVEVDTANEDEKNENSSVYNNNINIINYNNTSNIDISIDTNQQDLELQDNNIFMDITPENIKKNNNKILRAHTQAHTHTREDENQEQSGKSEEDGQEEIEIEVEVKPPEPEKPKFRKCYLDASDQSRLAVLFNEHKPKHWNPLKLARHERRQLDSYLYDEYRDGGIDELFKDIEDALEWCKIQSYWEANKGGIHSLLYRDNFVKWSQNYQEYKKPLLNATLDTANRTNGYDHQTTQTDNNDFLVIPPIPVAPQVVTRSYQEKMKVHELIAESKRRKNELISIAEKTKKEKARLLEEKMKYQNNQNNQNNHNPDDKKSA